MAPKVTFRFQLYVDNPDLFPELMIRVKDMRPLFDEIVKKWARNNQDKFALSEGGEQSGAQVDPSVYWEALAESTIKRKRYLGFPDQIMVETGALEAALTDTEGFFHEETAQEAAFGTPKGPEEEMKAVYNWRKRPVIFLGVSDQTMIEASLSNYLSFGANWKDIMFARGMSNLNRTAEVASMDMAFNDAVAGFE